MIPLRSTHIHQLAPHSVDSRVLSLEHRQLTRSHVHVTGDDGAELIAGKTGIDLGMHLLAIVLSTEWGEYQFAIGGDLTQTGYVSYGGAIAADPDNFGHRITACLAFNFGAS